MAATAQINVRIDPTLKAKGDEAFANAGYTPSQAIRKLWELGASIGLDASAIRCLLEGEDKISQERLEEEKHRQDRRASLQTFYDDINRITKGFLDDQGANPDAASLQHSYAELKEQAIASRYDKAFGECQ